MFPFFFRISHVHDPETDYFMNAKRKLRLVLSTSDCHACDVRNNNVSSHSTHKTFKRLNSPFLQASTLSPLLSYLQIQLAQAMNQQNLQQVSYVSELLRCLNSLDGSEHYKLIQELQKDLHQRQSYLQYLVRLRQDLVSTPTWLLALLPTNFLPLHSFPLLQQLTTSKSAFKTTVICVTVT